MSEKRSMKVNLLDKIKTREQLENVCKELGLPHKGSRSVLYNSVAEKSNSIIKSAINKVLGNG